MPTISRFEPRNEANTMFRVVSRLRDAKSVLVITGAGISAESGVPTFRGEGGWWRLRDAKELATLESFKQNPALIWEWYASRRETLARAEPNEGHIALAKMGSAGRQILLLTQNVDDLHERAGSRQVLHVHGSIWATVCSKENKTFQDRRVPLPELPPKCACGETLRPAVVWFDEDLPTAVVSHIETYLKTTAVDVVLVIGTEAAFSYIRDWSITAKGMGALLVEINLHETSLSADADVVLFGKAGAILVEIVNALST